MDRDLIALARQRPVFDAHRFALSASPVERVPRVLVLWIQALLGRNALTGSRFERPDDRRD